jgi:Flp pilus assembly pilin Flp
MVGEMSAKRFFQEDRGGPVTAEYVVFVAAIGILMAVGVGVLFNAMSRLFSAWAGYFMPAG